MIKKLKIFFAASKESLIFSFTFHESDDRARKQSIVAKRRRF
jgi:hypothetical protein